MSGYTGTSDTRRIATVLVVDDNRDAIEALASVLELAGHRVIATTSSAAALEAWTRTRDRIDLVVTDLAIPGMNGLDLARTLHESGPQVPVVVVSGYSPPPETPDVAAWLCKPVAVDDLLTTIGRILA